MHRSYQMANVFPNAAKRHYADSVKSLKLPTRTWSDIATGYSRQLVKPWTKMVKEDQTLNWYTTENPIHSIIKDPYCADIAIENPEMDLSHDVDHNLSYVPQRSGDTNEFLFHHATTRVVIYNCGLQNHRQDTCKNSDATPVHVLGVGNGIVQIRNKKKWPRWVCRHK